MSSHIKTVTERVWLHVVEMPDRPAALLKWEGPVVPRRLFGLIPGTPAVVPVTWRDYGLMIAEFTLFLINRGIKRGDRVAILGVDSLEWMIANRAVQCLGAIVVPVHANINAEQVAHILNDSAPALLLTDSDKMYTEKVDESLLKNGGIPRALFCQVTANIPDLSGKPVPEGASARPAGFRREACAEFERLKAQFTAGGGALPYQATDVCTLNYTSGSTSLPKGAMLTHKGIASSCELLYKLGFDFSPDDVILHYLPFAHVYGKVNGLEICEAAGVASAFCQPDELKTAMPLFRPTLLTGVPRVWNRFRAEISKRADGSGLQARMLAWALKQKEPGFARTLASKLVLSRVRKKMGADNLRLTLTGSAAIPMETIEFFDLLGMKLREGYGLTETYGGFVANTITNNKFGSLGRPGPGAEIRLQKRDIDSEPNTGILWVRGDIVFAGYWNLPAKNKEVFDADGWFNTGDVVHQDEDGYLWYRGRASRQKKLDTGEFYSEDSIQSALEDHPLVAAAAPLGEGKPFVAALIFLEPGAARKIAGNPPDAAKALEYYAANQSVRQAVAAIIADVNKSLKPWETVKQWEIIPVLPSIENELLTPTLKFRLEEALKRFSPEIAALYARKRSK